MVLPLVIAGVMAAGALAQAYQAEQARGANKKQLDDMKKAFDAVVPPDYDVSITDPPNYINDAIPEAAYDFSRLTPEQFKVVGQYAPQAAAQIAEKNPQLVTKSADAQAGRSAQMGALQKYRDIADAGGVDPVMQQQMDAANKSAQIAAQSRSASTLQDANRRGQLGSGAELAAQLQGGSDSMERAAMQSQGAAADAYKNRLQALSSGAQLGGQIGQQEQQAGATNADIINNFNQRTAANQQAYGQYAQGIQNQAQAQNLDAAQNVANRNTQSTNDTAKYNQQYGNQMKGQARTDLINDQSRQNQNIANTANWREAQKQQLNNLKSQQFGNQLNKAQGAAGIAGQQMNYNTQTAQDRNQQIQGATNAFGSYAAGQSNKEGAQDDRDWQTKQRALDRQAGMRTGG